MMDWIPPASWPNGGPSRLVSTTLRSAEQSGLLKVSKVPGACRALTVGEASAPERPVAAMRTEMEKRMTKDFEVYARMDYAQLCVEVLRSQNRWE